MASGVGQVIESVDFNEIRNKFYNVFGQGSESYGYGQTVLNPETESGDIMTLKRWSLLRDDMIKARQHQTGYVVGDTNSLDGSNLIPLTNTTIITEEIRNQYNLFADKVVLDRYIVHPGQLSKKIIIDSSRNKPWNNVITQTIEVSSSTLGDGVYDNFRYFFNAGGRLDFIVSRAGGSDSAKNHFWTELFNNMGTISFNYATASKSGSKGIANPIGFYSLTNQDQVLFSILGTGVYDKDYFKILGRIEDNKIIFTLIIADDATEYPIDQNINGILSSVVEAYIPSGKNVSVYELTAIDRGLTAGTVTTDYVVFRTIDTVSEGGQCTIDIASNDTTPRTIYWSTEGNVDALDFDDDTLTGSLELDDNGMATLVRNIREDKITEVNQEFYVIHFRHGSPSGPIIASTKNIIIEDTSKYQLLVDKTIVYEPKYIIQPPQGTTSYVVDKSLRLKGTNQYLTYTPSSTGNRRKWTYSTWVKRGSISTNYHQNIFCGSSSPGVMDRILFHSTDDKLIFLVGGLNVIETKTAYKDQGSWINIILTWDSALSDINERVRLYINGDRVTDFIQGNGWPIQNALSNINAMSAHDIGRATTGLEYFNGYVTETHFIDGESLDPSHFGSKDEFSFWLPKEYTGTYGTNGFYLNFDNNTNVNTLGYDFSGNDNHFNVNNIVNAYSSVTLLDGDANWYNYLPFNGINRYASRTFSSGDTKKYTFSFWVKLNQNSQGGYILSRYVNVNTADNISIQGDGSILFEGSANSSFYFIKKSTTKISPNEYYHITIVWDTTQVNEDDRAQIWINGVRETSYESSLNPGLNGDSYFNQSAQHSLGVLQYDLVSSPFNGNILDIHFIDGQALSALDFGQLNGVYWIPKSYIGAYGTNGFHLDISSTNSLNALGLDISGNNNNWTMHNFPYNTGETDSMLDTPNNNYNLISYTSAYRNDGIINYSGLRLSAGTQWMTAKTVFGVKAGKWYWETIHTNYNQTYQGICESNFVFNINNALGMSATGYSVSYYSDASINRHGTWIKGVNNFTSGLSLALGDVVGYALDMDNKTLKIYKNGVFTGTIISNIPETTIHPAFSAANSAKIDVNFGQISFRYAIPSGYKPLSYNNIILDYTETAVINPSFNTSLETITYTVDTTQYANGRVLYLAFAGDITDDDVRGGINPRQITIEDGTATGVIELAPDFKSDDNNQFVLQLRDTPTGSILASSPIITMINTSPLVDINIPTTIGTANSTYSYTLTTTNIPNGTPLYISLSGGGIIESDIIGGLNKTVTVNNNTASGTFTVANLNNFGTKYPLIQVKIASHNGPILTTSQPITIVGKGDVTYNYANYTAKTFYVPEGVTKVKITLVGGGGGGGGDDSRPGGYGAGGKIISGYYNVHSGQGLTFYIGGGGERGYNGSGVRGGYPVGHAVGGRGGYGGPSGGRGYSGSGGAGGGATMLFIGGSLIAAAGGGGGGGGGGQWMQGLNAGSSYGTGPSGYAGGNGTCWSSDGGGGGGGGGGAPGGYGGGGHPGGGDGGGSRGLFGNSVAPGGWSIADSGRNVSNNAYGTHGYVRVEW